MSTRIKVEGNELESIYEELSDKGHTLDSISTEIDSEFRNFLYKEHSMSMETFQKLKNLLEREVSHEKISYIDGKGRKEQINIDKQEKSAELVGIILGDGYLQEKYGRGEISSYKVAITVHQDENKLLNHAKNLLYSLTKKHPSTHNLKGSKATQVVIYSKEIIEELKKLGLQPGDKTDNQVDVPQWIKEDKEYTRCCLRGLVDTDGTIYRQTTDNRAIIQFKNFSEPLLSDFKRMCESLDYSPSKAGRNTVQIAKQKEVLEFINEVKPMKAAEFSF